MTAFHLPSTRPHGNTPGQPKFEIMKEQLQYLSSLSFSWSQIVEPRMTIYRRRIEFGLPPVSISSADLLSRVYTMRREMGETMVLRSMGIQVTRERVRDAVRQIITKLLQFMTCTDCPLLHSQLQSFLFNFDTRYTEATSAVSCNFNN